jgi:hypothetical protein
MKEQDIIDFGFERHDVTAEQSGYENDWHYYTYDFTRGFGLITSDSDEAEKIGEWYVEFFEAEQEIRFTDASKLQYLMEIIIEAKQ